jgi:hypothetical protein
VTALELLGVRERFETFPDPPDPRLVGSVRPENRPEVQYWVENLELAIQNRGDPELVAAIERCLDNVGRLAPTKRSRPDADSQRVQGASVRASEPMLFAPPELWSELKEKHAVVFLVGGYDGSQNYGDVAQLQATVDLLARLGDDLAVLPIVDLRYLYTHADSDLRATANFDPARVLTFATPSGWAKENTLAEGLAPVALPSSCGYAATYLYGGGYLNRRWADRMLTMVEACDRLEAVGRVEAHDRLSTGLQIDPEWAGSIGSRHRQVLAPLRQAGTRDELSARAAELLGGPEGHPEIVRTGDDAVGLIGRSVNGRPATAALGSPLRINLHANAGAWVTEEPERRLDWTARFIDALARGAGGRVRLQPVIAYEDRRTSERAELDRLVERTRALGIVDEVAAPILLRAGSLDAGLEVLSRGSLTIASSYHLALTSLLAGIPALLVRENDYYAQKADGLRRDFGLPQDFFPDPREDPAAAAERVASLLAPSSDDRVGAALDDARARVLRRREEAEAMVLEPLAAGLERARSAPRAATAVDELAYEELLESWRRAAELGDLAAAREAMLKQVSDSLSWRITGPLRRVRNLGSLRRRG